MANREETGNGHRQALECMVWAGTGALWSVGGGVPRSMPQGSANAAETGYCFLQISDGQFGFDEPANLDELVTLQEAIDEVVSVPTKSNFVLHPGDISYLSKPRRVLDANDTFKVTFNNPEDCAYFCGLHPHMKGKIVIGL